MTTTTSNLTQAPKATYRLFSIPHRGPVHRRPSAAPLYSPHQKAAVQLQPLLSLLSVLDPQVRHYTWDYTSMQNIMEDTLCALFASQKYKCRRVKKKICKEYSFFLLYKWI